MLNNIPSVVVTKDLDIVVQAVATQPMALAKTCARDDAVTGIPSVWVLLCKHGQDSVGKQGEGDDAAEGR